MDMIRFTEKVNLENYTLIIPSVSVGNVGQLANDLLITYLNLKSVATLYHKALIPAVGPNPYDPKGEICLACELYANQSINVAILQLRTSIEQKYLEDFLVDLKQFIFVQKIKEVLILTSSYAHELHDINSGLYRYITTRKIDAFKKIGIRPMECMKDGTYVIHGSGFAVKLYNLLIDIVETSVLIKHTSEGDNRPDAFSMFGIIKNVLENEIVVADTMKDIKPPYSWDLVFGGPAPYGIY